MSEIITVDEECLKSVTHIYEYISDAFGNVNVAVYAFLTEDKNLGFFALCGKNGLYIVDKDDVEITRFTLDEEYNLWTVHRNGFDITFEGDDTFLYEKTTGIEHYLTIEHLNFEDEDGYDGYAFYTQYNEKERKRCQVNYQHMYRAKDGIIPIYPMHLKKKNHIFLDYGVILDHEDEGFDLLMGAKGKKHQYYCRFDTWKSVIATMLNAYRSGGVMSALRSYKEYMDDVDGNMRCEDRYYRILYEHGENFETLYPFGKGKTIKEMDELITSEGFCSEVPSFVVDVYNEKDPIIKDIEYLLKQAKELTDDNKVMLLKIKGGNQDG